MGGYITKSGQKLQADEYIEALEEEVERLRSFVDFCAHGMVTDQTPAEDFARVVRDHARMLLSSECSGGQS